MSTRALFDQYRNQILADQSNYLASYKQVLQQVRHSVAKYRGQPISFLYQPMFLTNTDLAYFEQLTQQLSGILTKVIQQYLTDKSFRQHFGFSPLLEELILKEPGYQGAVPIGRFDVFYDLGSGRVQFCELNTDGSTGMQQQQELAKIFKEDLAIEGFGKEYAFYDFELFDSWVKIVQDKYAEFSNSSHKPQVAIVDWLDATIPTEFTAFQQAFERAGCPTVIADPRHLTYRDRKLYYQDFRIDCIYRRAVTFEMIEKANEITNFITAYLQGDVCVIGSIRSQIVHNKIVFALLHDQDKTPFLTDEERRFVKEYIPFTAIFDPSNANLVTYAKDHKDKLVLKPMDKYASQGVRIGKDYPAAKWQTILLEEAKTEYLMQEFCQIPNVPMAYFTEEKVDFLDTGYILGLFMYDNKLQGIYTRVGTGSNIGGAECFKVPNLVIKKLCHHASEE